jgi:hypothetical protein
MHVLFSIRRLFVSVPKNKDELIKAISENYNKLKRELLSIPLDLVNQKSMPGHKMNTKMSINNLVSYLLGWGNLVLKWHSRMDKGNAVDFPETGYQWNELGDLAQKFYSDYAKYNYQSLLAKLDKNVQKINTLVALKSDKQLYGAPWYRNATMGRMIQLNTASPYRNAYVRIRKWKKVLKIE